jgi:hypothetical protein
MILCSSCAEASRGDARERRVGAGLGIALRFVGFHSIAPAQSRQHNVNAATSNIS